MFEGVGRSNITASSHRLGSGGARQLRGPGLEPEEDLIYEGVTGKDATVGVYWFAKNGTMPPLFGNQTSRQHPECTSIGAAITGGVLVVARKNKSTTPTRQSLMGIDFSDTATSKPRKGWGR